MINENKIEELDSIIKSLTKLKSVYASDTFSLENTEEITKATRDMKKRVHKYLSDIDKYAKDRTATNNTVNGKLLGLARVVFDNAESSGQEGDIYLYDELMREYNMVIKYIETKDSSLKDEVSRMYYNIFREDLNKLPKAISIVGSSLEDCLGRDVSSPLYYNYTVSLYRLLKKKVMEGTEEFVVDITSRTCVFIITALAKLKSKYPNVKISGVAETNYLDIFLPKAYRELYFKVIEKLDEVIFLDEIDTRNHTSWYRRMQLEMYLTSSDIKECLVFNDEISKTLKECGNRNNCKVTLCNIEKPEGALYYCRDCNDELKDGMGDTVYCEVCGKPMCVDCGKISNFICNRCRK